MNTAGFWVAVMNQEEYQNIAAYALSLLIIPLSNAVVERIFSIAGSVKTKARNRMQIAKLEAIIRIREYCYQNGICCIHLEPWEEMIDKFDITMYKFKKDEKNANKI